MLTLSNVVEEEVLDDDFDYFTQSDSSSKGGSN